LRADAADLEQAKKAGESDGTQPEEDAGEDPAAAKAIAEFFEGEKAKLRPSGGSGEQWEGGG
jgi:hypothetical protein